MVRREGEPPSAAEMMHVNRTAEMWQGLIAYRASCSDLGFVFSPGCTELPLIVTVFANEYCFQLYQRESWVLLSPGTNQISSPSTFKKTSLAIN